MNTKLKKWNEYKIEKIKWIKFINRSTYLEGVFLEEAIQEIERLELDASNGVVIGAERPGFLNSWIQGGALPKRRLDGRIAADCGHTGQGHANFEERHGDTADLTNDR